MCSPSPSPRMVRFTTCNLMGAGSAPTTALLLDGQDFKQRDRRTDEHRLRWRDHANHVAASIYADPLDAMLNPVSAIAQLQARPGANLSSAVTFRVLLPVDATTAAGTARDATEMRDQPQ
jgi:hypothetical protein